MKTCARTLPFLYALLAVVLLCLLLPPVFVIAGLDAIAVTVIYSVSSLGIAFGVDATSEGRKEGVFCLIISAVAFVQSLEYYLHLREEVVAVMGGLGLLTLTSMIASSFIHRKQTDWLDNSLGKKIDSLGERIGERIDSMDRALKDIKETLQMIYEALSRSSRSQER